MYLLALPIQPVSDSEGTQIASTTIFAITKISNISKASYKHNTKKLGTSEIQIQEVYSYSVRFLIFES